MDLRVKKTKNAIINAFLVIRAKKPLERITVKELADKAMITRLRFIFITEIFTICRKHSKMSFLKMFLTV